MQSPSQVTLIKVGEEILCDLQTLQMIANYASGALTIKVYMVPALVDQIWGSNWPFWKYIQMSAKTYLKF